MKTGEMHALAILKNVLIFSFVGTLFVSFPRMASHASPDNDRYVEKESTKSSSSSVQPLSGSQETWIRDVGRYFDGSVDSYQLVDRVFDGASATLLTSRLELLTAMVEKEFKAKSSDSSAPSASRTVQLLKLQDEIDRRILIFNIQQRQRGNTRRWIATAVGLGVGTVVGVRSARSLASSDVFAGSAFSQFFLPTAVGGGLGLTVGEILARSKTRLSAVDLHTGSAEWVAQSSDARPKDLGSLVRDYIEGHNNGDPVAEALVADPSNFEVRAKFVFDEILARTSQDQSRSAFLYLLKHKVFKRALQHNESVFRRQDRRRVLGAAGGFLLGGAVGYAVGGVRPYGDINSISAGYISAYLCAPYAIGGGILGAFTFPTIDGWISNQSSIRMVTDLD